MPPEEFLVNLVAGTSRNLTKRMTALLQSYDLTYQQYRVLRQLFEENGLPARELVIQLSSDSSTIMSIVDRLEEKGLVKRSPDPDDRRVNRIMLTAKAKSVYPQITGRIEKFWETVYSLFSPEEVALLSSCLSRLNRLAAGEDSLEVKSAREEHR